MSPGSGYERRLSLFDATMVVVGGIIGAGIFLSPSIVAGRVESSGQVLLVWVLGGAIALLGALCFGELGARRPEAGGGYVYLKESFGRLPAFLYGWTQLLVINTGGIAAVAITFAGYAAELGGLGGRSIRPLAVGAILLLTGINYLGIRPGSITQNVFTLAKLAALAAVVGSGLWALGGGPPLAASAPPGPVFDGAADTAAGHDLGWRLLGAALIPVLFSYGGWQHVNHVAGEVRRPARNLPLALLLGVATVVVAYVLTNLAYLRVLGREGLAASAAPAAATLEAAFGPPGGKLIAVGIVCSTFGFVNLVVLAGARIYQAMAADGLFFRSVGRLHPRYHSPSRALVVQAVWAIALAVDRHLRQAPRLRRLRRLDLLRPGRGMPVRVPAPRRGRRRPGRLPHPRLSPHTPAVRRRGDVGGRQLLPVEPRERPARSLPDRGRSPRLPLLEPSPMKHSPYIAWAKAHHEVRFNLASSGVRPCPVDLLDPPAEPLPLSGPNEDGWPPLLEALAARYGVTAESVVLAEGASMANHLVCALLLEPGDHVLVERPVYEPLRLLPLFFHAEVSFVERRPESGFQLDPAAVERALTPRTRLLVCSNLHNPSGALLPEETLAALAALAARRNFHLLVDEVYLEWLHELGVGSAARLSPRILATRSLTKAFGLDDLRMGWILAAPELAERLRRLRDLYAIKMAHVAERWALRAVERAPQLLDRLRPQIETNRQAVGRLVEERQELSWLAPTAGTVGWIRLAGLTPEVLNRRLAPLEAAVSPGRFFLDERHFRIGLGLEPALLSAALDRLRRALDQGPEAVGGSGS